MTRSQKCIGAVGLLFLATAIAAVASDEIRGRIGHSFVWLLHDEVTPLEQWSGILNDEALLAEVPTSVDNHDDWAALWELLRGDEPLPEVDFESDLLVVATCLGPNHPQLIGPGEVVHQQLGSLALDRSGELSLAPECTLIGGNGFGYLLVRVSREGVRSVQGCSCD